jgi:hypothetical protein
VGALADHLIDTILRLGAAAGIQTPAPNGDSIDQRIQQVTQPILAEWRRRGLADVILGGRTLPQTVRSASCLSKSSSTAGISQ